jgi:peptidase M49-like protein
MTRSILFLISFILMSTWAIAETEEAKSKAAVPDLEQLNKMIARFAPTELSVDISKLSAGDQKAIVKLIEAARLIDDLYMTQLWKGGHALHARLQKDKSALGNARLRYFWINKGPWSDLDDHKAFLPGVPARKPMGANFYPEDMTKEEFEAWVKNLPEKDRTEVTGFYTVILRAPGKKLKTVPYSTEYRAQLERAAKLLRDAAALTDNASLKKFLSSRGAAFLSNDYYQSDVDWMDLDAPIDVTIGPYETYTDELFGYKAAFEAYVHVRDDAETAKLAFFGKHLQAIENNLPEDPQYRRPKLGGLAPIHVVNEVFAAGDGNHGVQTAAYNLPNDERVVAEKGSKRVMMKNVQEAKFTSVLVPISKSVLSSDAQKDVSFDAFFTHIVAHELTHGLGPQQINVGGKQTTARLELKELYGAIEEAKADVTGLFALQYLLDQGQKVGIADGSPKEEIERKLYTTFLASAFRTLRFGITEAHGKGMAMQMNYLLDKGAFTSAADGTFAVDLAKVKQAVRDLDHDLLTLEATGDYAGAKKMLTELAVMRPEVQRAIDKLTQIPTDIEPRFVTADKLAPVTTSSRRRR